MSNSRSKDNYKNRGFRRSIGSNSVSLATTDSTGRNINRLHCSDENYESVIFIWLDPNENSNANIIGPLRAINDNVQTFSDSSVCFDTLKTVQEKIFFICSSSKNELIANAHAFNAVEAIFILDPNTDNIKGDFPKLFGIFNQQEELFRVLKEVFNSFEELQLEEFAFEKEPIFLWSQLWKEDLINRKLSSNKTNLVDIARRYYRDNPKIIETIQELEKSYRSTEVITWCFRSPFPTRLLLHSLRYHNKEQLSACRFLFADLSRFFQQHPKHKSSEQFYRGMKISSELLARFETHVGQLICTSGFFPCIKSRTNALTLASLSTYRRDLLPVLFKVDCDMSSLFTEIQHKNAPPSIVFDVCITFRVIYVNRGQMSIIKLKTASEAGKKFALEYLENQPAETRQTLLDEILKPPTPPTPPPPPPPLRTPTPPSKPESAIVHSQEIADSNTVTEEMNAREYVEKGEIDLALISYQRIQPVTARILNMMGLLCADRKGDYSYALQCHEKALKLQEESGEDIFDTLTYLGNVCYGRGEFDSALGYHKHALELRQMSNIKESAAVANNLFGIAQCNLALHEHSEATSNAERALELQEALLPPDDKSTGATLVLLGNIYKDNGDNTRALEMWTKALLLLERATSDDSTMLAELLYKLGIMHSNLGALVDAQKNLERSYKIYKKLLPRGHQDRMLTENELRRVLQQRQKNKTEPQTNS